MKPHELEELEKQIRPPDDAGQYIHHTPETLTKAANVIKQYREHLEQQVEHQKQCMGYGDIWLDVKFSKQKRMVMKRVCRQDMINPWIEPPAGKWDSIL